MRARKCQVIIRQRLPKCLHIPRHMHVYHGFPAFAQLFPKRARTCHSAVVHTLMDLGLVLLGCMEMPGCMVLGQGGVTHIRAEAYWHELVVLRDGFVVCGSGKPSVKCSLHVKF